MYNEQNIVNVKQAQYQGSALTGSFKHEYNETDTFHRSDE